MSFDDDKMVAAIANLANHWRNGSDDFRYGLSELAQTLRETVHHVNGVDIFDGTYGTDPLRANGDPTDPVDLTIRTEHTEYGVDHREDEFWPGRKIFRHATSAASGRDAKRSGHPLLRRSVITSVTTTEWVQVGEDDD